MVRFGRYGKDYYPHFAWTKRFKCIPVIFGNVYITNEKKKADNLNHVWFRGLENDG